MAQVANATGVVPGTAKKQRRVATASFFGSLIEFYDFIIYGTAAALVFPKVFFPALDDVTGTLVSMATFGVAFVARPFGGILFGYFGDRVGRKKTLVSTLLIMGMATVLVGLTPPAAQIGVAAPLLLVFLRILQGLAAGGEWAGAVLFSGEHAPRDKRGFWGLFPIVGGPMAGTLANLTFLLTGYGMAEATFLTWGWRIPFLLSAVLIFIGLYVRLKVDETPVFKHELARSGTSRVPLIEAFARQRREILLGAGIGLTVFAFNYFTSTYMVKYATTTLGLSRESVLTVGAVGGLFLALGIIVGAIYSDRVGRRPVIMGAHIAGILWALAIFPILELKSVAAFAIVLCITMLIGGFNAGPMGTFLSELFHTRYRYTATALSYNMGSVVGGAIAPLLAAPIVAAYGGFAYGIFLAALCLIATVCTLALRETRGDTIEDDGAPKATSAQQIGPARAQVEIPRRL
jgi:MFS family permease